MRTGPSLNDAYELAAADFVRAGHRLVYGPLARPLVDALKPFAGERAAPVLDVAAGAGAFGGNFSRVVALDFARAMLAINASQHRVQADASRLPFRDTSFAIAGCTFGINHVPNPKLVVREMARVAPVVGLSTWLRPEPPYAPKQIVNDALEQQVGTHRSATGRLLDDLSDAVGSVDAVTELLADARLEPAVSVCEIELAWPGVDAYLEYRLGMPSTPQPSDRDALRAVVSDRVSALSDAARTWRAAIVVGVGRHATRLPAATRLQARERILES